MECSTEYLIHPRSQGPVTSELPGATMLDLPKFRAVEPSRSLAIGAAEEENSRRGVAAVLETSDTHQPMYYATYYYDYVVGTYSRYCGTRNPCSDHIPATLGGGLDRGSTNYSQWSQQPLTGR